MLYDVNTERIQDQLGYLDTCLIVLEQVDEHQKDLQQSFATARALHIAVECIVDIGSVMIDGFIMRDPGGYQDIVDILTDEQVIPHPLSLLIGEWVTFRERLIRQYTTVTQDELLAKAKEAAQIRPFITHVQAYLRAELK